MEEKEILIKVGDLFFRFGIKSMTMDEIARQLGISKKTLYQFVENKNDLVVKVMQMKLKEEKECIYQLYNTGGNPIDELMEITQFVRTNMKEIHPSVLFDLKKYHADAWQLMSEHKETFIYSSIMHNLKEGVKGGLYRDNLVPEIIAKLYLGMVNVVIDKANFPDMDYSQAELHEQMIRYHIRGIASEKGRSYLKEKFKANNI